MELLKWGDNTVICKGIGKDIYSFDHFTTQQAKTYTELFLNVYDTLQIGYYDDNIATVNGSTAPS